MMRLAGKIAVIVGAGQSPGEGIGNGRATVLRFAQEGARILAVDRDLASAEETAVLAAKSGCECVAFQADVTREATLAAAMVAAVERWGRIDILHNNVGVSIAGGDKPLDELTEAAFDHVSAINLRGTIMACKHVLPIMRRQRSGAIVNISSVAAYENTYPLVAYKATKAAMIAFTEQLALHNAPYGIRANCILPGLMDTPMAVDTRARAGNRSRAEVAAERDARVPLRQDGHWLGRRQRGAVPGLGRSQFHYRRRSTGRWRRAGQGWLSRRSRRNAGGPCSPAFDVARRLLEPPAGREYCCSLLWRWRLGTFVATEPAEDNNRRPLDREQGW
jgi:NAD(P)-dependent dehydrogenase (short-subunit alcohol dehydrogenase family)